jgi:hypothetical protein
MRDAWLSDMCLPILARSMIRIVRQESLFHVKAAHARALKAYWILLREYLPPFPL